MSAGKVCGSIGFADANSTLNKLGVLHGNYSLNTAGILFCDDNVLEVQAAVFAGTEKITFLDIQQLEGNLFELLKASEEYIKQRINWSVKFGRMEREEIPEIPTGSLREAIVNSLCHRDYYAPEANKIAIYKNRVEIFNPGEFPAGMAPEDFIKKPEQSVLKNPLIAEGLYLTKDIEKWGYGLKKIFDECREKDVKVEFKTLKTGFMVVFYRKEKGAEEGAEKGAEKLAAAEIKIIRLVGRMPAISKQEIMRRGRLSKKTVEYNIQKLKQKGILRRIGPDRGGRWEVIGRKGWG